MGHFPFYRRRRVLPFSAAFCLVFINGATLAPNVLTPAEDGRSQRVAADHAAGSLTIDQSLPNRLRYERGSGAVPSEPVIAANVPQIVKNLRRDQQVRHGVVACFGQAGRPVDAVGPLPEFTYRARAANAADFARLCRLLL